MTMKVVTAGMAGTMGCFPSNYVLDEVGKLAAKSPSFLSPGQGLPKPWPGYLHPSCDPEIVHFQFGP